MTESISTLIQKSSNGFISDWIYVYKYIINENITDDLKITIQVEKDEVDRFGNAVKVMRPETVLLYQDDGGPIICIPRYSKYGKFLTDQNVLLDNRCEGASIPDIEIQVEPRDDYQKDAINAIINNDHGIVCAKTAFGKTYVTINAICKLKTKALILVHKSGLADQWKLDFLKYTNLKDEDIQIFQGDKFDPLKPITISTIQNIMAKIRAEKWAIRQLFQSANFGITIYDECHTTVGPIQSSAVSRWIFSKRIYGLSATPKRGDEMDKVISYLLGDVIYTDDRKMLPVYTTFIPYNIPVPSKTAGWMLNDLKQFTVRYNKWIKKYDIYIDTCANTLLELIKADRKILAVGAIKNLLDPIYKRVEELLKANSLDPKKLMMLHGTTNKENASLDMLRTKEVEDQTNCIISTNKFFSEGISIPWFNTLVYLTPPSSSSLSSIPQLVGRIVREYKNKKYVLIVDIFNEGFTFESNRKMGREKAYSNLGYLTMPFEGMSSFLEEIKRMQNNEIYLNGETR